MWLFASERRRKGFWFWFWFDGNQILCCGFSRISNQGAVASNGPVGPNLQNQFLLNNILMG